MRRRANKGVREIAAKAAYEPKRSFWTLDEHDVGFLAAGVFVALGVAVATGYKIGKKALEERRS